MKTTANKLPMGSWLALLLAAVTSFAISSEGQAGSNKNNPQVISPQGNFRGLSYGEWGAEFWKALFSIPVVDVDQQPYFTGEPFPGPAGMVFLIFPWEGSLDITIPAGSPIFCGIIVIECSTIEEDPFYGEDEAELRACANALVDESSDLFAEIDGVPVQNLSAYRAESPLFEFGPLPEGNLFDYLSGTDEFAGTTALSVAAGIYLVLPPLSVGTHTIHARATYPIEFGAFDGTYNITVVPGKQ